MIEPLTRQLIADIEDWLQQLPGVDDKVRTAVAEKLKEAVLQGLEALLLDPVTKRIDAVMDKVQERVLETLMQGKLEPEGLEWVTLRSGLELFLIRVVSQFFGGEDENQAV